MVEKKSEIFKFKFIQSFRKGTPNISMKNFKKITEEIQVPRTKELNNLN